MQFPISHSRPSRFRTVRKGFTLIEMLIVIAIIGILAAILFPVFGKVRENGRATACASNLKQLGLAFLQYTQDTGGRLPYAGNFQGWGAGGHWVAGTDGQPIAGLTDFKPVETATGSGIYQTADVQKGALYTYVRESKVYVCPSNSDGMLKKLSYSMNCAVAGAGISRITSPTELVLLADESSANDGFFFAWNTSGDIPAGESTDAVSSTIHNGKGNLLYADGHVKPLIMASFPIDASPQGLANKSLMTGPTRFHAAQLGGKSGTAQTGFPTGGGAINFGANACAQTNAAIK